MKIGIIGGGAVGLLFSGYLGRKFDVTLITKREEQKDLLIEKGVTVKTLTSSITTKIKVMKGLPIRPAFDLLIIALKEYDLKSIGNNLELLGRKQPLMFLQNGIGHLEWVKELPHLTILVGSVEHGALKVSDSEVHHMGKGKTNIAYIRGEFDKIEELLSKKIKSFPFILKENFEEMLLSKLFVNVLINPLTALTGVTNGKLIDNPHFYHLQHGLFQELLLLFPHMKDIINLNDIKEICINTYDNHSSMLKDIESHRRTELDSILGILVEKASRENHFVPIMNILYQLIKGIEREG